MNPSYQQFVALHQTGAAVCCWSKSENNSCFSLSLRRSPLWWRCSCWLWSATTTSLILPNTNAPFLWISFLPYPGECVLRYHTAEALGVIQGNWPLQTLTASVLFVVYFSGRWTLILWSICMISCEAAVREGEMTHGDSKIKRDLFLQEQTLQDRCSAQWDAEIAVRWREDILRISLPPCG